MIQKITLGAGCFWCVEAIFLRINGVLKVVSGYSGGSTPNPTYEFVCSPQNDYVEVCQIEYDENILSTETLLEIFWNTHDPTTLNRQGNDVGYQYRSVVYYHTKEQKEIAENVKLKMKNILNIQQPILTTIEPLKNFYIAESYHQNYYNRNPNQGYCSAVIKPKLTKYAKYFKSN